MYINCEMIKRINEHMGDNISKKIFSCRLLYSLTADNEYIRQIISEMSEGIKFYELLDKAKEESDIVIFGGGVWGRDLYKSTRDYPWKYFVDSRPSVDSMDGMSVISFSDFMKQYHGETFVIASRIYYKDMYQQLIQSGVKEEKIINAGYLLDELSKRQYFDLEVLKPEKEEFFVDAGSFDGMTSVYFSKWCMESGDDIRAYVYAFEPDRLNAQKCHRNLQEQGIEHEIIKKGCWKEETTLCFHATANGASGITSQGEESVDVTPIDKALEGKKVSFIKMDIEGAEIQALDGAQETIRKNKPKLAISIYHKPEDIWKIPERILEFYPNYRFYLRHYSLADFETVLYALP